MANSTRDPALVAVHRGGRLTESDHRLLVKWAAICAQRALPLFEAEVPDDSRPAEAIAVALDWSRGEATVGQARTASVAAHAAARETNGAARFAARACGHAVATAHMADHELGAAYYSLLALQAKGPNRVRAELDWQLENLPNAVHDLVRSDMVRRSLKFRRAFDLANSDMDPENTVKN